MAFLQHEASPCRFGVPRARSLAPANAAVLVADPDRDRGGGRIREEDRPMRPP